MTKIGRALSVVLALSAAASPAPARTIELDSRGVPSWVVDVEAPIALSIAAAIKEPAGPEELAKIEKAFRRFSALLWKGTWGNMHVERVLLRNGSTDGYVTLEKLPQKEGGYADFGGPFVVSTRLLDLLDEETGIRILAAGMLHEFSHSFLELHDEYPYEGEPYRPVTMCVMDPRSRRSTFCPHCQGRILERFTKIRFPADADPESWAAEHPAPETSFTHGG